MERAGHEVGSECGGPFDKSLESIYRRLTASRSRSDGIGLGRHEADGRAAQAQVVEFLADLLVMLDIALEYWNFNAVITYLLQLGENREMIGRDVRRP